MELLVTYDVDTTGAKGRKRLRRMARLCEAYGQRVQQSVFECTLDEAQREQFVHELSAILKKDEDSLRIYRLRQPRAENVEELGKVLKFDLHHPLIV